MSEYIIETRGELQPALSQEWLLTNGTGAFSSGTIVGCNTRRYHALLCAATMPPVGRIVALNRIHEAITVNGGERHEFSINQFSSDTFFPRGERYLRRVVAGDCVRWEYEISGVRLAREILLCWGRDVAVIRYHIEPPSQGAQIDLSPIVSLRDFHSLQRVTNDAYEVRIEPARDVGHSNVRTNVGISIVRNERTLKLRCENARFHQSPDWWRGHYYAIDAERGQDHVEDLYTPGQFQAEVSEKTTITLIASMTPVESIEWDAEVRRRAEASHVAGSAKSSTIQRLTRAANDFVVGRKSPDGSSGVTVIAGYPWFADWGRDTMIALPGLLLATRRFKEAAQVLGLFAAYVSEGMIPNKFDDYTNEPQYNTVDASLWFIHAAHAYLRASEDRQTFEKRLLPACRAIIDGYMRGTRFNIRMDPDDGLISQGDAGTQLTWMDAKCDGVAFTPRQGKPVEINALWYNALMLMGQEKLAARVRESFARAFWISPFRGLADVVNESGRDASIRPNQIFAASLPHSPLDEDQQRAVVEVVRRELLTPVGLRTLAPGDPKFHETYSGPQFQRDLAYHNGTIWPWLIGGFLEAYLKVKHRSRESIEQARSWLTPLIDKMGREGCIGQIAEIFEAREPHRAVGCCAQAWSVAEVLRLAMELGM